MTDYKLTNPYDLMGLNTNSSINELKKAYYHLSLLCHPDKGGNKEDMMILHRSYKFISEEFSKRDNQKTTYQELEDEFTKFCKEQEFEKPPSWSQIYHETNDWINEFNNEFNKQFTISSENHFEHGYGDLMEKSESITDVNNYDEQIEKSTKNIKHLFNREIQIYQEPESIPNFYGNQLRMDVSKINNFTGHLDELIMTDYKEAFTPAEEPDCYYEIIDSPAPSITESNNKLEDLIRMRKEMDENNMLSDFTPKQYLSVNQKLIDIQKKNAHKVCEIMKAEFIKRNTF
jgi:curved DNA-binding protein CbpA